MTRGPIVRTADDELQRLARRTASGDLEAARRAVALIEARRGIAPPVAAAGDTLPASEWIEGVGPDHVAFRAAMKRGKGRRWIRVVVHVKHIIGLADAIRRCPTRWPGGHGAWHYQRAALEPCEVDEHHGQEAGGMKDEDLKALGLEVPANAWRA